MADRMESNISEFQQWLSSIGLEVYGEKDIQHGRQLIVTDSAARCQVNFYSTGKIVVQGKKSNLRDKLSEWANLQQAAIKGTNLGQGRGKARNRIAKYFVPREAVDVIEQEVIPKLPGTIREKEPSGPADIFRYEVRRDGRRVTITQYQSGTLMVQGSSSTLFDDVCDVLDTRLSQPFSARAARYIPGDDEELSKAASYLDRADAENEALVWLENQPGSGAIDFCFPNDRDTLVAAAGVRNTIKNTNLVLPDYSVVVMPFAKSYEGFLIKLAIHLGIADEKAVRRKATEIEVTKWLNEIEQRIPDRKRYGATILALKSAWQCRHKAIHSDPEYPFSILQSFGEAEAEISTITRAMRMAHTVFCEEGVALVESSAEAGKPDSASKFKFEGVNRERLRQELEKDGYKVEKQGKGRRNEWEIINRPDLIVIAPSASPGLIIVEGDQAPSFISHYRLLLDHHAGGPDTSAMNESASWIGVDESGKGDLFGPLVIAGVVLSPESEIVVAKHGIKDSKSLSDGRILELAHVIRHFCEYEIIALLPPEYNKAYVEHNSNLNDLLAWGHAEVIARLQSRTGALAAVSDQFADENLLLRELEDRGVSIDLDQRPGAEDDLAVASASVLARAAFIETIRDYTKKSGIEIPRGSSSPEVLKVAERIYSKWGEKGLQRICKMHFKTIKQVIKNGAQ